MGKLESRWIFAFVLAGCILGVVGPTMGHPPDLGDGRARAGTRAADRLGFRQWSDNLPGPMCGLYAACTAAELVGLRADPKDYLMSKYLGGCGGSSAQEVAMVVRDAHGRADILSGLSAFDLRLIRSPLIANVRSDVTSDKFDHWVVATPDAAGMTIFDGLKRPYTMKTAEFLAIWNGVGVCVARGGPSPVSAIWLGRVLVLLGIALVAVVAMRMRPARCSVAPAGLRSWFGQAAGLLAGSLALAVLGNSVFGDLANHSRGAALATASRGEVSYKPGTLKDARRASASDDVLLVDARFEPDYRLGTIANAVNIPVSASHWEIETFVEDLPRTTPVVVFCQSNTCSFDEKVASELTSLGFSDVTVCDEGWAEYQKAASRPQGRPSATGGSS